jgi:hypothetical protein
MLSVFQLKEGDKICYQDVIAQMLGNAGQACATKENQCALDYKKMQLALMTSIVQMGSTADRVLIGHSRQNAACNEVNLNYASEITNAQTINFVGTQTKSTAKTIERHACQFTVKKLAPSSVGSQGILKTQQ